MPHPYLSPLTLLVVLCTAPASVLAQIDSTQQQAVPTASPVLMMYVNGVSVPVSPEAPTRVRQHIAQLGPHGGTRRIIYPIIMFMPSLQVAQTLQRPAFTQEDLDRLGKDALQEASRPPGTPLSVEQVEGALLETGLFESTDVIFRFDQGILLPVSTRILDTVGEVLVRHPEVRLEVAGHTDSTGPEDYNQQLSEARAAAVRTYLLDHFALAPERLIARGYGETQPVASNDTPTGRALNRRVVFRVLNP